MAVQPIRSTNHIQTLDNAAELTQLLKFDRDAILCFFEEKSDACLRLETVIQGLADRYNGTTFVELDLSRFQGAAQQYRVEKAPTFLAMSGGQEVERLEGGDEQRLTEFVARRGQMRERRAAGQQAPLREKRAATRVPVRDDLKLFNEQRVKQFSEGNTNARRLPHIRLGEMPLMRQCEPECGMAAKQASGGVGGRLRKLGSQMKQAGRKLVRRMKGTEGAAAKRLDDQHKPAEMWSATLIRANNEREFNRLVEQTPDAIVCFVNGEWDAMAMSRNVDTLGLRYPAATFIIADMKRLGELALRYNVKDAPAFVSLRGGEAGEPLEFVGGSTMSTSAAAGAEGSAARNLGQYFPRSKRFTEGGRRKRQFRETPQRWGGRAFQYGSLSRKWRQQQQPGAGIGGNL